MLLPCVIGVIAAILFFMGRDNDTFKNLRTIPVTSTRMILAKIMVLFLFGLIFCLFTAAVTIICGSLMAEVNGLGYKLWMVVEMAVFVTAGTLPLVVLVFFFSKTYIFSVLLCIFYSVLSLTAENCFGVLPTILLAAAQITLNCLFLYIAVLPVIAIAARIPNGHLIGAVVAFVYGYAPWYLTLAAFAKSTVLTLCNSFYSAGVAIPSTHSTMPLSSKNVISSSEAEYPRQINTLPS